MHALLLNTMLQVFCGRHMSVATTPMKLLSSDVALPNHPPPPAAAVSEEDLIIIMMIIRLMYKGIYSVHYCYHCFTHRTELGRQQESRNSCN